MAWIKLFDAANDNTPVFIRERHLFVIVIKVTAFWKQLSLTPLNMARKCKNIMLVYDNKVIRIPEAGEECVVYCKHGNVHNEHSVALVKDEEIRCNWPHTILCT